jgi:hypothetical protein
LLAFRQKRIHAAADAPFALKTDVDKSASQRFDIAGRVNEMRTHRLMKESGRDHSGLAAGGERRRPSGRPRDAASPLLFGGTDASAYIG